MGASVRHKSLFAQRTIWLLGFALSSAVALAQTPGKEPFPFDWLRHDAAPTNRAASSPFDPPMEGLDSQKRRQQIEPSMAEPQTLAAPAEAPVDGAPMTVLEPEAAPASDDPVPTPTARPAASIAKAKPAPVMDQIDVVNKRSVTLNELKLVSLKDSRKPFVVRPSLKPGQSLTIEIPREWGCLFLVWTQFSEEPLEQYDGVDLCGERRINLVN